MNTYYTLIYLTEHLNHKLYSAHFDFSISPHKNVWEGYFNSNANDKDQFRLIFSTTPGETALFTDKYRPPKKSNVLNFFDSLKNKKVLNVELAEGDRLITINFSNGPNLLFQLFGNQANLFLVDNERIKDSFKNQNKSKGKQAPKPRKPVVKGDPDPDLSPRQMLLHYDQKFPRHLIKPVIDHFDLENAQPSTFKSVVHQLTDSMVNQPSFRVLSDGNLCLIPDELLPLDNKKTFNHVNEAIKYTYYKASHLRRFEKRRSKIESSLKKMLKKTNRAIKQLEKSDKALDRADKYEENGHLLMANAHKKISPSDERIKVEDFYNENEWRTIELKPRLSISENAEYYYDKAAKARRRVKESERREKELKDEKEYLGHLLNSLYDVENLYELEDWEKEFDEDLKKLGFSDTDVQKKSLPYFQTEYKGYQIWIGKSAKSNDQLTTDAHKEDIWLHARGAGGSHVVIRMENNKELPPMEIIHKAASYAAWHSKLRGSSLVPVIYTKRKYVSKPKGAPSGTVRVHREDVMMVKPENPRN
jgi:predicted ribosome quality control (RQC) complex YloA/Tae2 family protein